MKNLRDDHNVRNLRDPLSLAFDESEGVRRVRRELDSDACYDNNRGACTPFFFVLQVSAIWQQQLKTSPKKLN